MLKSVFHPPVLYGLAGVAAIGLVGVLTLGVLPHAKANEEPEYTVVLQDGAFEVRRYEPMIVAEITVEGSEGRATSAAFNPLFGYISGRNSTQGSIDMTAPVTQAPRQGTSIDMTAPVTQAPADGEAWTVAFVMPRSWTMETLPVPYDRRVTLREIPERTVAALRYSGRSRPAMQARKREELAGWLAANGLVAVSEPEVAFYNAPSMPGPFRRNEILVAIDPSSLAAN